MFKDVSKEFQASIRIRRRALPLSSAKDELQQHLQGPDFSSWLINW
jgi:hypothetical protein